MFNKKYQLSINTIKKLKHVDIRRSPLQNLNLFMIVVVVIII